MKEMYVSPAIEVIEYEVEDVVTTSVIKDDDVFEDQWEGING